MGKEEALYLISLDKSMDNKKETDKVQQDCEHCDHFIGKDTLHFYRGKFLWCVVLATIFAGVLFFAVEGSHHKALHDVVEVHNGFVSRMDSVMQPLEMAPDSCLYVNEQLALSMKEYMQSTQSILQLESHKIQSDYTILSIWAGILMIVFLVFSIYSMFKTDELIKQGRAGLKEIEEAKNKVDENMAKIDKRVEVELKKVTDASDKKISDITEKSSEFLTQVEQQANQQKENFKKMVDDSSKKFNESLEEVKKRLTTMSGGYMKFYETLQKAFMAGSFEQEEKDSEGGKA